MQITNITLFNFRKHVDINFSNLKNKICFYGANGSGKTSILEAINILAFGKPFSKTPKDVIKADTDFTVIKADIQDKNIYNIKISIFKKGVNYFINEKKVSYQQFLYQLKIIVFSYKDLDINILEPNIRRRYLNYLSIIFNNLNINTVLYYNQILQNRNKIIKNYTKDNDYMQIWNQKLANEGIKIINNRQNNINKLNTKINQISNKYLSKSLCIKYIPSILANNENEYIKILKQNLDKDLILKHTSLGPHRDDFVILYDNKDIFSFTSRGERKMIIYILKLAEKDIIQSTYNIKPILLLDDIFAELDSENQKNILENFSDNQIFLTSLAQIKKNEFENHQII